PNPAPRLVAQAGMEVGVLVSVLVIVVSVVCGSTVLMVVCPLGGGVLVVVVWTLGDLLAERLDAVLVPAAELALVPAVGEILPARWCEIVRIGVETAGLAFGIGRIEQLAVDELRGDPGLPGDERDGGLLAFPVCGGQKQVILGVAIVAVVDDV